MRKESVWCNSFSLFSRIGMRVSPPYTTEFRTNHLARHGRNDNYGGICKSLNTRERAVVGRVPILYIYMPQKSGQPTE